MAHQWTDEELTKFYEGVNRALKKLLRKITALDSGKVSVGDLESLNLQLSDGVTVAASDDGLETTVSDLEGRMSSIEQTASSITLRVQSAETAADEATASAEKAESTFTQTAEKIELRVQGAESSASNAVTVADSAKSTADNAQTVAGSAKSTADNAANSASEALKTAESAVSTITQLADSITLSVENGSQTATIALSVNGKTHTGTIDLSGLVTFSDLSTEGKTTIHGGNIDTESLFSQAIKAAAFTLERSSKGFPTFTLNGTNSSFSISATNTSMQEPTTFVQADGEIYVSSDAAIVLSPGSKTGGSGYDGVVVEGDLTVTGSIIGGSDSGAESGSWTPSVSGCSRYSRRDGWYIKVGNVVTVGWDVYCSSTSSGSEVTISGLPYTPGNYAWGGGCCSGYSASDGVVFFGWGLTSSGYITGHGHDSGATTTMYQGEITCTGGGLLAGGTITYTI
jgi:hypothetical protein